MDFELSAEQIGIVQAVRDFCSKEFTSQLALEHDRQEKYPLELYQKAAKLGFTSIFFPEEYGGQGCGLLETCLVIEELCRADSSLGAAISSGSFGSELILEYGHEEQKNKYLPSICAGKFVSAAAFTEPNVSGSDITVIETIAKRTGDK